MATYRSKFERPKGPLPKLQIQDRDVNILELCFRHRFLTSDQLHALLCPPEQRANRPLRRRLQLLWLHGLLDRPKDQEILRVREGLRDVIYALGVQGAKVLAQYRGYDIEKVRWVQKNDTTTFMFMKHALLSSQVYTCLELALAPTGVKLQGWRQGREIHDRVIRPHYIMPGEVKGDNPTIRPDAMFSLVHPDASRQYFFLEADLSTIRERNMLTRFRKYWAYWEQGGFTRFGIPEDHGFRVLVVSNTVARRENLRRLIQEAEPWRGKTTMFWFATTEWSLEHPGPVLDRWRTPRSADWHSLISQKAPQRPSEGFEARPTLF